MDKKTHYRKVFKSDHLGVADLEELVEEGNALVFTIKHVKQEYSTLVAGKKIDANIAYFDEKIKPLVLNATNSRTMKAMTGSSFVEDWCNVMIQLEIDLTVKMKGATVGGVRIAKPPAAPKAKPTLTSKSERWAGVVEDMNNNGREPSYYNDYFTISGGAMDELTDLKK